MRLVFIWVSCLLTFVLLTILVKTEGTLDWDLATGKFVQSVPILYMPSYLIMYSGWGPWLYLWLGAIGLILLLTRKFRAIAFFVFLFFLDTLAFFLHVNLINRPRPTPTQLMVFFPLNLGSYPSGHVLLTSIVFLFLAAVYRKPWVTIGSIGVMAAVGIARIYSGQHFATDVLGAYLLAVIIITPVIYLYSSKLWRN